MAKFVRVSCPHCGYHQETPWAICRRFPREQIPCSKCRRGFEAFQAAGISILREAERQYPGITKDQKPPTSTRIH
jgi:hypothetical protein